MLTEIIALTILLVFSAFFSGSETALFSISEIKIRRLVKEKKHGAKTLQRIKSNPSMLLSTILIGNNIVNIAASAIATVLAIRIFGDIGAGIAVGVLTILILIFGEIFPKSFAYNNSVRMSLIVAKPLRFFMLILWPISKFFSVMNEKLTKPTDDGVTEEDVKIALTMGEEAGSIEKDEKLMIHNIFEFSDTNVSQIMTSRDDMVIISSDTKVIDALRIMIDKGISRLPVFEGKEEDITGIVNIKDLLRHMDTKGERESIKKDIKPVLFVPETQKLDVLINELRKKDNNMAIVIDENGIIQGLVTVEDLVEEIVGEIYDETDVEMTGIKRVNKRTIIVQGKTKLIDLKKRMGIKLTEKDINTVAGFIMDYLEKLPKKGEMLETEGYLLTVTDASDKEILKVKIERK